MKQSKSNLTKRTKANTKEEPAAKVQKVSHNPQQYLHQLETILQEAKEQHERDSINFTFESAEIQTKEQLDQVKQVLDEHGFVILLNAISPNSFKQAMKNTGNAICDMWSETLRNEPTVRTQLQQGKLHVFEKFRNSTNGHGNASFAYYYKQPLSEENYPAMQLQGEQVTFDHNSVYSQVNLELLSHPDNKHATLLLMALTHLHGFVSWDSLKYASNPSPKPKEMTKQTLTRMHIDHYSEENQRFQAIDNNDGLVKLFFVPGTDSIQVRTLISQIAENPSLFTRFGHKLIHDFSADLRNLFIRYSIAPPPFARVIWKSGIIHFEGCAKKPAFASGPYNKCFACKDLSDLKNENRIRFVIGTQIAVRLSQESLMRLAIAAERGLLPAMYGSANSKNCLHPNIVNRKSTQWKQPRTSTTAELELLRSKLDGISNDEDFSTLNELFQAVVTNPFKAYLYGVHTPIQSLQLSDQEAAFFESSE
jgi:hypothetical protein